MEKTTAILNGTGQRQQTERRIGSKPIGFQDRRACDWRRAADRHTLAHRGPGESTVAIFFRNEAYRLERESL